MEVEPSVSVHASTSNNTKPIENNIRSTRRSVGRNSLSSSSSTTSSNSSRTRRAKLKNDPSDETGVKFELGSVSSESMNSCSNSIDIEIDANDEESENLKKTKITTKTPRNTRKSLQILNNKDTISSQNTKLSQIDEEQIIDNKKSKTINTNKKSKINNLDENTLDGFGTGLVNKRKNVLEDKIQKIKTKIQEEDSLSQDVDVEATSSVSSSETNDNSKINNNENNQVKFNIESNQIEETTNDDCDNTNKKEFLEDEDTNSKLVDISTLNDTSNEPKKKRRKRTSIMLHHNLNLEFKEDGSHISVSKLFVYKWPMTDEELDEYDFTDTKQLKKSHSDPTIEEKINKYVNKILSNTPLDDLYVLQEQFSEYLGIKSFKRKYPDVFRRLIEIKEREFLLRKLRVVTEAQCDLGLTALKLNEILDLMADDYPDKYKEFDDYFNEKRRRAIAAAAFQAAALSLNRRKSEIFDAPKTSNSKTSLNEKDRMKEMIKKAIRSVAAYNSQIQKEKQEERKTFYDLQTMRIQTPQVESKIDSKNLFCNDKKGHYPVSLLSGQFQYHYKKYSSDELKYFPVDTVLYAPPIPNRLKYIEWKRNLNKPKLPEPVINNIRNKNTEIRLNKLDNYVDDEKMDASPVKIETNRQPIRITASAAPTVAKLINTTNQVCHICQKTSQINQNSTHVENNSIMISCSSCPRFSHPDCLELNPDLVDWTCIRSYDWQCMDCKKCSKCKNSNDEEKMMFCDRCDRGFHTYCVDVDQVPTGSWLCKSCTEFTDKLSAIQEKINSSKSIKQEVINTPSKIKQTLKQKLSAGLNGSLNVTPNNGDKRGRGRPPGSLNKPKDSSVIKKNKTPKGFKVRESMNGIFSNSNSQMYSQQSPMTGSNLQYEDDFNESLMNYETSYELHYNGNSTSRPYFNMDETSNSQFQF
ncbi:unnamed protein product [Brachionus calyciflorus]|uniref:PHD-type domain-containing protein n=1 Tax=Brachionus calyciflorus TaxID=104777 RepID=A0A813SGG4_9BILA|nr:unnamed protein product [Brachionus calyciflorus]